MRSLPWIAALFPLLILFPGSAAVADGFHSPLLHNSDPHTWADSVRSSLGMDKSSSADEGPANRAVPGNTVRQLVDVLKYLRSKNVLLHEFPNFNYKSIPGFLSETESLLIAIGKDSVPLVLSTLVTDLSNPTSDAGLEKNEDLKERLIRILIAIGEDALDQVMKVAAEAGGKVRAAMLRIIKGIASEAGFGDDLEGWQKWHEIWKAGRDRRTSALPALLSHLLDEDPRIRLAAVQALGRIRNRSAVPGLRTSLMEETDPGVRRAAIRSLVLIGDLSVAPDLITLLESPVLSIREEAVTGLRFLSRLSFGYDARGDGEERAVAAARWWAWWRTVERK